MNDKTSINRAKLDSAAQLLEEGLKRRLYPGAVLYVSLRRKTALTKCVGHTDFSRKTAVTARTIFDLASLTKPLATAPAILLLHQDGLIDLDQSITDFFPNRNLPHLSTVTLRHLLTHTSGLPPWRDLYSKGQTRDQAIDELFTIIPEHDPGTDYAYSCLGYIMLGLVVEVVSGQNLDEFTRQRLFEPMGMHSTTFNPLLVEPDTNLFAATGTSALRKRKLIGEVHDENAFVMGGVSGNAGLFSNINDIVVFCHSVINPHESGTNSPLEYSTLKIMLTNSIPEKIGMQSIGWFMAGNSMLPIDFVSKTAIGHTGFTGTAIIIDPEYELVIVLLSNIVCQDDDGGEFRKLRRNILNAAVRAIV